jgi:hypothetical protein
MPDHKANYRREKRGLQLLAEQLNGFYLPTADEKKRVLEILGVSRRFKETFDGLRLRVNSFGLVRNACDFDLLELKVTDKYLPNLPEGFFFGLTHNEEMLLKVFEGKYFLCLVCMNQKSPGFQLVDWTQLENLPQNKRVQYQINLKKARKAKAAAAH